MHEDPLVGFVNVAWDGAGHAFLLDTLVAESHRRQGIGGELVRRAALEARVAGCEWLHVDFEEHLTGFYFDACGFVPALAGTFDLRRSDAAARSLDESVRTTAWRSGGHRRRSVPGTRPGL